MSVEAQPPHHPARKTGNIRWIILGLIILASFIAYVLRTNLSITGERMMHDLGMSEIQLGMVFSAFAWGYALFQLPGGVFGDFIGARKALAVLAGMWGVLTIATGIVPGTAIASATTILLTLIAVRFLVGVTQAPLFPITSGQTIANWFPVSGWGLPNGLTSTGTTLGAAAAAPLIVWLMETFGWRESFFLTAPLAFFVALIWWWYVRDYPADHHSVGKAELDFIDRDRPPPQEGSHRDAWKKALRNRDILLITASYFCMNYVFYLFFSWFFYYLVDVRKFPEEQAGYLTAVQWIAGAAGAALGGLLCDRLCKRFGIRWGYRLVPIVFLFLTAVLLFAGAVSEHPLQAVVLLSLCFGCTQLTEGAFWAATISVSGRHAGPACGVLNTGGNAAGGIGALLVPVVAHAFGWTTAVATGALFALAGCILWFFIRADQPMQHD